MKIKRILSIIAFSAISLLLAWQAQRYAYSWSMLVLKEQGESRLLHIVTQFRAALREHQYLPFLISHNHEIKKLLLSGRSADRASLGRYLQQLNLVADSSALFILDPQGQLLAYSHLAEDSLLITRAHQQQDYFLQAKLGHQGFYIALGDEYSVGALYFSAPIYAKGGLIGVATVRVNFKSLQAKLAFSDQFAMSQNGKILIASNSMWVQQRLDQVFANKQLQVLDEGSQVDIRALNSKKEVLLQSVLLDDIKWHISVLSSTQASVDSGHRAKLYTLGSCIALLLLLLWLRERHLKNLSRQETQTARARSEENQREMIKQVQVGLLSLNERGKIQFINPMVTQLFQCDVTHVQGMPITQLIADISSCAALRECLKKLSTDSFSPISSIETSGLRTDNSYFPMLFSIKRILDNHKFSYLVTVIDLTQIKRLEDELHRANDQLELKVLTRTKALKETQNELVQAEKMAALGRMSSAVVHELNQPLTAIKTYISICRAQLSKSKASIDVEEHRALQENFTHINQLSDRMAALTRQLKIFAYKKPTQLVAVDLTKSLHQAVMLFSDRLNAEQIELCQNLPENLPFILGDAARIEQIFYNLIKNSCDAMALNSASEPKQLVLSIDTVEVGDSNIAIRVSDTGGGIAAQDLMHLFEPFFTTKRIGEGLGLGLSIVQSIVLDLGGDIRAYNTERGCCFCVRLPLYQQTFDQQGSSI